MSEMLFRPEGSEWAWREDQECLSFEGRLPSVLILGMARGFVGRLSSTVIMFSCMVERSLQYLLQLDVGLSSAQDIAHPSDIVL